MKAIRYHSFGGPKELRDYEDDSPQLSEHEVLIDPASALRFE